MECAANAAYEAYRARGVARDGRPLGRRPKPYEPPETPAGKINVTDPDSRNIKSPRGYVQGYNAQAATNEHQIVIAAEISADTADFGHLEPMVTAAQDELENVGVTDTPGGRGRGCGLLAPGADGDRRQPRDPGADPARRAQACLLYTSDAADE